MICRSAFEEEQIQNIAERMTVLEKTVTTEQANLKKLEDQKDATEKDIASMEEAITGVQEELKELNEVLEEKTKIVEQVKRTTAKAGKGLDQALKEISSKVCRISYGRLLFRDSPCDNRMMISRSLPWIAHPYTGNVVWKR